MNTRGLLDQLLKSGQELLQQKTAGKSSSGLGGALGGLLGGNAAGAGKSDNGGIGSMLKGAGGGAALAMLLGNKRVRKVGGTVAIYGGLAALGVIAYKAYGNWQAKQAGAPKGEPQTIDRLPAPEAELHSQSILKALVAAAKADGHVDERERELIEGEFSKLASDSETQRWLHAELNKPLDPADVARAASTPEMAAEMYVASVLMVDEEHFMERAYLDELARHLKLDPALKAELEAQVRQDLQ
ncbi:hypothetical protein BVH03_21145 [Pseudomonas sp. PA15(2017)]|uniref:tellurite resistance TerB family protein n=1 Tax=Pseudomonas sp. PA15(2017) TaxID=1932111 RepID=UPI0009644C39|nr:tellurite resistance TerB family protein [Pseudomonas sp. PA15(2017)]OLU23582.1 hypothetical protein BVH03_21145 [Pseudomonas sp. PA15(2017)]